MMGILIPIKIYLDGKLDSASSKPQSFLSEKEKRAIRYAVALNKNYALIHQLNHGRHKHGLVK